MRKLYIKERGLPATRSVPLVPGAENVQEQKMTDLPADRRTPTPPFTYFGVDYFGPWYVKEGRKELKRYGVLFTCLVTRAIHTEVANSLETDSYVNALCRRFICQSDCEIPAAKIWPPCTNSCERLYQALF